MQSKEEWPVLDVVEIQAVSPARVIEGTEEGPFIREQRTVDIVGSGTVFYAIRIEEMRWCSEGKDLPSRW